MHSEIDIIESLPIFFSAREEARYKFCEAYRAWTEAEHLLMSFDETMRRWDEYVRARETWLCI